MKSQDGEEREVRGTRSRASLKLPQGTTGGLSTATLVCFPGVTFFFFLPCGTVCGILVPRPGIKPVSPALEAWSLKHWTTRDVPSEPVNSVNL